MKTGGNRDLFKGTGTLGNGVCMSSCTSLTTDMLVLCRLGRSENDRDFLFCVKRVTL